ncbi:MAG: tRNA pseudouridine(55) synthase TruB, partial [Deltaproteobacteria bacterium]|nr:tRNA pseudouridine(55) synthase TruB [Deltaproteobacteria bacterium]
NGRLIPPRLALGHLPELPLPPKETRALCQGQKLNVPPMAPGTYKIISPGGSLVAIGQIIGQGEATSPETPQGPFLRPLRVLEPA